MDYALGEGINFFDTAELYPSPPKEETQGRTEEIIGSWFAARASATRYPGHEGRRTHPGDLFSRRLISRLLKEHIFTRSKTVLRVCAPITSTSTRSTGRTGRSRFGG